MKSDVYFTNFRATMTENLLQKLERLVRKAGIEKIDFQDKFVAIKIHFGEPGNLAFLRPNYAKVVADVVKSLGGKLSSQTVTLCMLAAEKTLSTILMRHI